MDRCILQRPRRVQRAWKASCEEALVVMYKNKVDGEAALESWDGASLCAATPAKLGELLMSWDGNVWHIDFDRDVDTVSVTMFHAGDPATGSVLPKCDSPALWL